LVAPPAGGTDQAEKRAMAMQARAVTRYVRCSPQKANQVLELIRGKGVEDATDILNFTQKRVARTINKTLKSAVSNALEQESKLELSELSVKTAIVGDGPTMKRFRARAQGRVYPILKRTSHITIVVGTDD
jgi:large subunit ribosomal protein L22